MKVTKIGESDVKQVLDNLSTEGAKAIAVYKLLYKQLGKADIPQEYLRNTVDYFDNIKDYDRALTIITIGGVTGLNGRREELANKHLDKLRVRFEPNSIKSAYFDEAIKFCRDHDFNEKVLELYNGSVEYYEKKGQIDTALCYALEGKLVKKIFELYKKLNKPKKGVNFALKLGKIEEAIQLCEEDGSLDMIRKGAKIAAKNKLKDKEMELYSKIMKLCEAEGYYDDAQKAAKKLGLTEKIRMYRTLKKLTYN